VSGWRIEIPPHVADAIRHLPPGVKGPVKAALRELAANPDLGEPLRGDLGGLRKLRARRYRVVYAADRRARAVRVFAVGHRRGIYDEVAERRRRR
jgi:mRNA-degrading endonuclease RelE of RelBE toxin-antitoxin system